MTKDEKEFMALLAIGVFTIDEEGRVWRHRELQGGSRTGTPPIWKPICTRRADTGRSSGRLRVQMTDRKRRLLPYAARLVWMYAYQSDIPPGIEVNHMDGDPTNNRPDNLELVTRSGNMIHAKIMRAIGGGKIPRGKLRLTAEEAKAIRELARERRVPQRDIASAFGVNVNTVQNILYGKTWASLSE